LNLPNAARDNMALAKAGIRTGNFKRKVQNMASAPTIQ